MKQKLIIDTDGGSDDAFGIAMALRDPRYQVLMILTVAGNTGVEQATRNVLTTIEHSDSYCPEVFTGSGKMLLRELAYAYETHGQDGLGDCGFAPRALKANSGWAVLKLLETLAAHPDKSIDLVTLGPLTNLALALRIAPRVVQRARRITVMGSAGLGVGNVTPVAEFNIWQDPEAAKIVLEAGLRQLTLVGWDACLETAMLNQSELDQIKQSGALGGFLVEANRVLIELNQQRFGYPSLDLADGAAMAVALYPECIARSQRFFCEVDTLPGPSYGAVVVDRNHFSNQEPNLQLCWKLDAQLYKTYLLKTLTPSCK